MSVPTPDSVRKTNRRLDRRNATKQRCEQTASKILEAMRNGASLHRCNRTHRTIWLLSTGPFVTHEAATDVLRDPHVVGVGDALFGPELSQTFRYIEGE